MLCFTNFIAIKVLNTQTEKFGVDAIEWLKTQQKQEPNIQDHTSQDDIQVKD